MEDEAEAGDERLRAREAADDVRLGHRRLRGLEDFHGHARLPDGRGHRRRARRVPPPHVHPGDGTHGADRREVRERLRASAEQREHRRRVARERARGDGGGGGGAAQRDLGRGQGRWR